MGQAFLPTLAIVWIHTGIALGARWSGIPEVKIGLIVPRIARQEQVCVQPLGVCRERVRQMEVY